MHVLVTGATGYIGGRLVPRLLELGHRVRCVARDPDRLAGRFGDAEIVEGDLFDGESLVAALEGIEVAYYLVHSMGETKKFAARDREGAELFANAARAAGVKRIVYLGGLGVDDGPHLSEHLKSRHDVGRTLRSTSVPVTEFRAAIIVGSGSVSFEMIRYLTERLPLMITPKWVTTKIQPISVRDVLAYLTGELARDGGGTDAIFEIGGADVMNYGRMMERYAAIRGLARRFVRVPFFSPRLSSHWVHLMTPIPASIARPLIDGLRSEVVVRDDAARRAFPEIRPVGYDEAVGRALDRYSTIGPATTWFDAYDVRQLPNTFAGITQGMHIDRRRIHGDASVHAVFAIFTSMGGTRGWLYADWLWELRGWMDTLVGGSGTRRGRRHATELRVGDAVDFWRVEAYEPDHLLRLRAEMKVPGKAWLQFEALPEHGGASLRQTAFFEPRGLFGQLYWYAVLPFHGFIFANMAKRIIVFAEQAEREGTGAAREEMRREASPFAAQAQPNPG